jgi:hypothetical protein
VSPKVSFIVEKTERGIRVAVKGKPGSEELIPLAALKESIGKAAYVYYALFAVMLSLARKRLPVLPSVCPVVA